MKQSQTNKRKAEVKSYPYSSYSELMAKVYPKAWKKFKSGQLTRVVWVDDEKSWNGLDPFIKQQVMEGLIVQEETGERWSEDA